MSNTGKGARCFDLLRRATLRVTRDLLDRHSLKEPVTITTVVTVVVVVAVAAAVLYGIYKLVQLVRGAGTTATPSRLAVSHDDAVVADANGKQIKALLTRRIDGNPMSSIDIRFEISGGATPEITSTIGGVTTVTRTTNVDGEAEVTITGTGDGADVCTVSVALGGSSVRVPYETRGP